MRLAFVVNNYPPHVGGVELHAWGLGTNLAKLGHEVTVFTLAAAPSERHDEGVRVIRMRGYARVGDIIAFPSPLSAVRIWRELRSFDAVSVHTRFFPMTWLGVAAAKATRTVVVLTEHGSNHVASDLPLLRWGALLADLTVGRLAHRGATKVIGVSPSVVAFVQRLSGVRADVFSNAINLPPSPTHGIEARPWHLVFVGRLVSGKGWSDFVDTVIALRSAGHRVTADVLGGGPDLEAVREKIMCAGLDETVSVRGPVQSGEVLSALRGATLVNPTVLSEGFQTTLLEALAVEGRIVTYAVPGADVLAAQDAPIVIVDRSVDSLVAGVEAVFDMRPWRQEQMLPWTWQVRAAEYATLIESLLTTQARRQ